MASSFNVKSVHRDGRAELKVGLDDNSKIFSGQGDEVIIRNNDGSPAVISVYNIPYMPENVNENNKLVTQDDLRAMMEKVKEAMDSMEDAMSSLMELSQIVGLTSNKEE